MCLGRKKAARIGQPYQPANHHPDDLNLRFALVFNESDVVAFCTSDDIHTRFH